jgi:UDP-glucose:glycoprotein glucosyltransferase
MFKGLPRKPTLTLRVDHAEAWNVQATRSQHDLDNLVCDDVSCGDGDISSNSRDSYLARAQYSLKSLSVSGQCYEGLTTGRPQPPNGLQLILSSSSKNSSNFDINKTYRGSSSKDDEKNDHLNFNNFTSDTLVMKNLGYFQLQATPGLWSLSIAPGKGADIFTFDRDAYTSSSAHARALKNLVGSGLSYDDTSDEYENENENNKYDVTKPVAVTNFYTSTEGVFVTRRPGMEMASLLDGNDAGKENSGMWSTFSDMFSSKKNAKTSLTEVDTSEDGKIHVFSLAPELEP